MVLEGKISWVTSSHLGPMAQATLVLMMGGCPVVVERQRLSEELAKLSVHLLFLKGMLLLLGSQVFIKKQGWKSYYFLCQCAQGKMSVKSFKHELQSLVTNPNPAATGGKKPHVNRCRLAGLWCGTNHPGFRGKKCSILAMAAGGYP